MDDIDRFLKEDIGEEGDITSDALFKDEVAEARIIAKEDCVVAGLEEAKNVFKKTKAELKTHFIDGDFVSKNTVVVNVKGSIRSILKAERLVLNIIGRMSGVATETKKLVDKCKSINPKVKIAATRKTTPGFRKYEKKAVVIGGGEAHRMGLYDAVIIKDNHVKALGSIKKAIEIVKQKVKDKVIEVEVETLRDAVLAAKMKVDVIMLDNFNPKDAKIAAEKIREIDNSILIEISGGITSENIVEYADFADRISLGYLTHSIKNIDYSLEIF